MLAMAGLTELVWLHMPVRNIEKDYVPNSYYHIYNRGVERRPIFMDDADYVVFMNLLKRYLSGSVDRDQYGRLFTNYAQDVDLLAYCLMPNHFHLLIYVDMKPRSMAELMRGIDASYTVYFNRKYNRVGHLFQSRYRASRIDHDDYLLHISRYIHLNPENYTEWPYSSLPEYLGTRQANWVKPLKIMQLFGEGVGEYETFLEDYLTNRQELKELSHLLANDPN
jgi:putative transposase